MCSYNFQTQVWPSLADLGGGVPGARHPLQDPILSLSHKFSPKSAHVGGPHPPNGSTPPQWEILDPPLALLNFMPVNVNFI